MKILSTRQMARRLGIDPMTLSRYIAAGKVPEPETHQIAGLRVHAWREEDVERLRKLLPKIANGRKAWRQKKQSAGGNEPSAKKKSKPKKQTQQKPAQPEKETGNKAKPASTKSRAK